MHPPLHWIEFVAAPILVTDSAWKIIGANQLVNGIFESAGLNGISLANLLPDLQPGVDCPRRIGSTLWTLKWRKQDNCWVVTFQREIDSAPSFLELQRLVAERTAVVKAMFDASPLAIAHIIGRTIVDVNHAMANLFGYSINEIRGETTRLLFRSDEEFTEIFRRYDPILKLGQTYRSDYMVVDRSGREFVCNIYGKRLDPEDASKGMIWLYDDVTDRRNAEEELRRRTLSLQETNEALKREMSLRQEIEEIRKQQEVELARVARLSTMGEMASALAHELSQPLMATTNYLGGCQEILQSGDFEVDEVLEALGIAVRQNQRAGDIIKHIKQFVRKQTPQHLPVDLNQIIREMVSFTEFEAKSYGVAVVVELATDLPRPIADKIEIEQVVMNLIKNAMEALRCCLPPQRRVVISTIALSDTLIEVSVKDWGEGIPTENLIKVFEPFYSTKSDGTGFGLAICQSIIKSHGGHLWAEPNPDGGAIFKFTLPGNQNDHH